MTDTQVHIDRNPAGRTLEVVHITPEMAASWLANNINNRSLRERTVARYAADMRAGRWLFTGDPILFAQDGTLIQGQHRLAAIPRSGVDHVCMMVGRGFDEATRAVLDTGVPRKLTDVLKMNSEANYNILAGSLRYFWLMHYDKPFTLGTADRPSTAQALELLKLYPQAREAASKAAVLRPHLPLAAAVVAFRWYQFGTVNQADRDDFFYRLKSMDFRGGDDPLGRLMALLAEDSRRATRRYSTVDRHALLVKTWNYYRDGVGVKTLSWKRGGSIREGFPEPI
jgi:hypothetical protein